MSDPPGHLMVFAKLHKGGLTDGKIIREAFKIRYKWTVLMYAEVCRTVTQAWCEFNVEPARGIEPPTC
jgi:hypothetical protein